MLGPRSVRLLGWAAITGAAVFAVLESAQTMLRSDHAFADAMSVYAIGRYGFVQTLAFAALAVGSACLWLGLGEVGERSSRWQAGRTLVGLWSLGVALAAVFPIDDGQSVSWRGTIHQMASLVSFTTILAAMFFITSATHRRVSLVAAPAAAASFVVAGATQHSIAFGIGQRVFLAVVVVWISAAGARLLGQAISVERDSTGRPAPSQSSLPAS